MELSLVARIVAASSVKGGVPFGQISETLRDRAIAAVGQGPDHTVGERLAMVLDHTHKGESHFLGAVVTDAGLAWAIGSDRGSLRWAELAQMTSKAGLVKVDAQIRLLDGRVLSGPLLPEVIPLVDQILRHPPEQRVPPPQTLAERRFIRPDSRHQLLLDVVGRRRDASSIDAETARDLGGRVMLLHRTVHFGRGAREAAWLSALAPLDLLWILSQVLGPPLSVRRGDESFLGEFAVPPRWTDATVRGTQVHVSLNPAKAVGRTIGSSIANSMLAGLGIGGSVDRIQIGASRHAMHTAFGVDAIHAQGTGPLQTRNHEMLALLLGSLVHLETRQLLLRALAGPAALPGTLAALPPAEVATQLRSLGLDTDLRWFGY